MLLQRYLARASLVRRNIVAQNRLMYRGSGVPSFIPSFGAASITLGAMTLSSVAVAPIAATGSSTFGALTAVGRAVSVPTDGPDAVFLPSTAAHWVELGLVAPSYQWNCDEASGDLTSDIGSLTLPDVNTGHLYEQTVSGWTAKFIGFAQGADGAWFTNDNATDVAENESYCWLLYLAVTPSSTGEVMFYAGSLATGIEGVGGGATLRGRWVSTATAGSSSYSVSTVVPMLFGRNCATDTSKLFTTLEQITGTHSDAAIDTAAGFGGIGGVTALSRCCRIAFWKGADAETMFAKSTLTTLRWTVAY